MSMPLRAEYGLSCRRPINAPMVDCRAVLKSDVERILLADDGSVVVLVLAIPPLSPDPRSAEAIRLIDRYGRQRSYTVSELKTEACRRCMDARTALAGSTASSTTATGS